VVEVFISRSVGRDRRRPEGDIGESWECVREGDVAVGLSQRWLGRRRLAPRL